MRTAAAPSRCAPSRRSDMKTPFTLHRPEPTPDVDPDPTQPGRDDPVDPPVPDGLPHGDPPSHPPPMRMPGGHGAPQPAARPLKGGPSWTFTCNRQTSARSLRCWAAISNRARCVITSRSCPAACCISAFAPAAARSPSPYRSTMLHTIPIRTGMPARNSSRSGGSRTASRG
ncbi:hypothetical protein EMIT0111MI5_10321 [Burkholderia sp. IT-111MI5]